MTRKESIELAMKACKETWNEKTCKQIKEALEQESSGDLISRQAVIYYIKGHIHEIITESGEDKNAHTNRVLRALMNGVETMPPVNPQEPKYCDRNICIQNEYNGIGCDECEVTKSQESSVEIVKTEESNDNGTKYLNINVSDGEVKRNPDVVRLCSDVGVLEYVKPCGDVISRSALMIALMDKGVDHIQADDLVEINQIVLELPSVKQEPKTGHWIIDKGSLDALYGEVCKCSECGAESIGESDYCPDCGAKMVEPQESDHKCHTCKHYTSGENDGSCGSYICKGYSDWEEV